VGSCGSHPQILTTKHGPRAAWLRSVDGHAAQGVDPRFKTSVAGNFEFAVTSLRAGSEPMLPHAPAQSENALMLI
jgi:hypothetical protein